MYIYFDVNGNLREIVSNPVREGSYQDDQIFIYVEPGHPPVSTNGTYPLPGYSNAKISFANLDTGNSLNGNDGTPLAMTTLTGDDAFEIPYDSKRDLKWFKYGFKYEGYMITLPSTVTEEAGIVVTTPYLYNIYTQKALNTFTFNVEVSVGIALDSTMSESQYSYLYNKLQGFINLQVPYTGATQDVNLGNNSLITSKHIHIQGAIYDTYIDSRGINITANNYSSFLDFPILDTDVTETIATQEWVTGLVGYNSNSEFFDLGSNDLYLHGSEHFIELGAGDYELTILQNRFIGHYDGVTTTLLLPLSEDENVTETIATQEWVKSRHNGIYEVSSDFFPTDNNVHTITVDLDTLIDIAENANALVNPLSITSLTSMKQRNRITVCEVNYTNGELTKIEIVYGSDYPENNASHHYIYWKQAWSLIYNSSNNSTTVKLLLNVDNS